jgi:hypothetical protein
VELGPNDELGSGAPKRILSGGDIQIQTSKAKLST